VLEARALNSVGWVAARTGRYDLAEQGCRRGLAPAGHNQDLIGEADGLYALGYLARRTTDFGTAIEYVRQAIAGYRNPANTHDEASCLAELGNVHAELRSRQQAMAAWQAAAVLYQAHHRGTDSARVQRQLASLDDNHSAPGPRQPTPTRA
jgi:tetratricopeptide (TPR) repeat protein